MIHAQYGTQKDNKKSHAYSHWVKTFHFFSFFAYNFPSKSYAAFKKYPRDFSKSKRCQR